MGSGETNSYPEKCNLPLSHGYSTFSVTDTYGYEWEEKEQRLVMSALRKNLTLVNVYFEGDRNDDQFSRDSHFRNCNKEVLTSACRCETPTIRWWSKLYQHHARRTYQVQCG
jgi:hypothetical protein